MPTKEEDTGAMTVEECITWLEIDPTKPTDALPGSEVKIFILSARYATGTPMWHPGDNYQHGPGDIWRGNQLFPSLAEALSSDPDSPGHHSEDDEVDPD